MMKHPPENILKLKSLRLTKVRIEILNVFLKSDRAVSFLEIKKELGSLYDDATIFRTLKKYLAKGIIHQIPNNEKTAYYGMNKDLFDGTPQNSDHLHFCCSRCGETYCIEDFKVKGIILPKKYKVESVNIIATGICEKCR